MSGQDDFNNLEAEVRRALSRGLDNEVSAPPFVATRILAEFEARQRASKRRFSFRWIYVAVAGAAVAIVAVFLTSTGQFSASTLSPVAVRVDLHDMRSMAATTAEVEVPTGVQFYSKSRPEIKEQKTLRMALQYDLMKDQLPIVVRATEEGSKKVRVKFLDEFNRVVSVREVLIRFKNGRITSSVYSGVLS